jgi:phosphatidylinositol-3-phosphatase
MENKEYGSVIGNPEAPYVNGLARRFGLSTGSYAVAHPSLPNYLAFLGGSTFGITTDCTSCAVSAPNLVDQLERAGISWKAYMEGLPSPCYRGPSAGEYAKKHDPFLYFDDIAGNATRCSRVVPFTRLTDDLASGALPAFAWVTPDLCHDMHDCGVATGDAFLAGLVPKLQRAMGPGGVLFLTWDEGATDAGCCGSPGGGHVATIVVGSAVRAGTRLAGPFSHYSILRTIESVWGLPPLLQAGCSCTELMTAFFAAA